MCGIDATDIWIWLCLIPGTLKDLEPNATLLFTCYLLFDCNLKDTFCSGHLAPLHGLSYVGFKDMV